MENSSLTEKSVDDIFIVTINRNRILQYFVRIKGKGVGGDEEL